MHAHIKSPARTATTISSVCPKCGTIAKSGKTSCCSRGGSWFKTCGGAGNTRLQHTWYEGIQACKARAKPRANVGQQENAAQQTDIHGDGVVTTTTKPFAFSLANISTPMADTTSIIRTVSTSTAYDIHTTNSKVIGGVVTAIISMSDNISILTPRIPPSSTPATVQGHENLLLNIALHINLLVTIVFPR